MGVEVVDHIRLRLRHPLVLPGQPIIILPPSAVVLVDSNASAIAATEATAGTWLDAHLFRRAPFVVRGLEESLHVRRRWAGGLQGRINVILVVWSPVSGYRTTAWLGALLDRFGQE